MGKILLSILFSGCATAAYSDPVTNPVERASMIIKTDSLGIPGTYIGTATMKRQASRKFRFELPKNTLEFYVTTCHRELAFYKPASVVEWTYVPAMTLAREELEMSGNCLITATAIKQDGKVVRGIISYSGDEDMQASVYCNNENNTKTNGHYLCQGRESLIQSIYFDEKVHANWKDKCPDLRSDDNQTFNYNIASGFCTYAFRSFDGKRRYRLTTYGYKQITQPDYE
jgi:hypothetical protein